MRACRILKIGGFHRCASRADIPTLRGGAVIILAVVFSLSFAVEVLAIGCWLSDESGFGFHDPPYATNEVVYISGEWDIFELPCCRGHVYMVANNPGNQWNSTQTIPAYVTRKTIQGCAGAGAFYGAILKLPPLPLGEYDIVMDENEDNVYHYGTDFVLGQGETYALKVLDYTLDEDVDVAGIKASALSNGVEMLYASVGIDVSFKALGLISTGITSISLMASTGSLVLGYGYFVVGAGSAFLPYATSYNGAVTSIGSNLLSGALESTAQVYLDIAADPPDSNYTDFAFLDSTGHRDEISESPAANMAIRLQNNLLYQDRLGTAFRRSYEKFLGAEEETDYEYTMLQARDAGMYCDILLEVLNSSLVHMDTLEVAMEETGWADSVFTKSEAEALQQRLATAGFYSSEIQAMHAAGMTDAEIDSVEAAILAMDLTDMRDSSLRQYVDSLRTQATAAIVEYEGVAADLDSVLAALSEVWTGYPHAVTSGGDSVPEGTPLLLTAEGSNDPGGGSLDYAWDLDGDGDFDDGDQFSVNAAFNQQGEYLIGLEVSDSGGLADAAYKLITVIDVNHVPTIVSALPDTLFMTIAVDSLVAFAVSASDPDEDSLSYTWFVDSTEVSTGCCYDYTPSSEGLYQVKVKISDGSVLSPDNYQTWRVSVEADSCAGATGWDGSQQTGIIAAHPNPFSATTVIAFSLHKNAMTSVHIHNVKGQLVRSLKQASLTEAGQHFAEWDGKNADGGTVASGIYFCVLKADDRVDVKRVVLVR